MTAQASVRRLPGRGRPDFLALHAADPARYPFLLESLSRSLAAGGAALPSGRYDLLCAAAGEALALTADGRLTGPGAGPGGFLAALDRWFAVERDAPGAPADGPPFVGGWFLYLGYELASEVEPRLRLPPGPPLVAYAARVRVAAVHDAVEDATFVVAEPGAETAAERVAADLAAVAPLAPGAPVRLALAEDPPERYLAAVRAALGHIAAGDVYQANLARAWRGRLPPGVDPADLYARLRRSNPGPFGGIARLPGTTVLSTSPERLVVVRGDVVETRPIAGTRPRTGRDEAAERAVIEELRANPKERAEHVMLIDLERNDLGRICTAGSVEVSEFMTIESYAHVHHIVSNVRGRRRPDATPGVVIRALFPGGTITGCPKVRCMELIGALEGEGRGAYTGSMGWLGRDGSLDLNILIRTATVADDAIEIRAGAGIVADSDPERELEETRAKARGLLRGLGGEAA